MSVDKCKIHFNPDNLEIVVDRGTNLLSAALAAGVHISASCNSMGACGTCKVKIESGSVKSHRTERIAPEEYDRGIRQACLCQVISDLTVIIPLESRVDRAVRARERSRALGAIPTGWKFNPPIKKYLLNLPPASQKDNATDYFRIMYHLNRFHNLPDWPIDFEVIPRLTSVLRAKDWQVTITLVAVSDKPPGQDSYIYKIINAEPGDTRGENYAVAVDVGTTSIFTQLLDLNRGRILAETMVHNKQIQHGAGCLERIEFSRLDGGLKTLQAELAESINEALDKLLDFAKVDRRYISYLATAGNTTMQHLLVEFDPGNILKDPYIPVANFIPMVKAYKLGINLPDHVYMFSSPNVSSFIGGDITAGIVASGIYQRKKLTLYMDIGTTSELVIGNSEWMVSAACLAGPVFEGVGIKNGMIAMPGAIQDLDLDDNLVPTIRTIADQPPRGICGSGLINVTATLLLAGVIGQNGRFNPAVKSAYIRKGDEGLEFVLVKAAKSATGQDLVITEKDIDKVLKAKAAIYAASCSLEKSVNVVFNDIEQFVIAGSFGSSMDIEKAITIGLLPDQPREKFVFIGNSSLTGTRLISFSTEILEGARKVAQTMTDVELNEDNNYQENYKAALAFPHAEAQVFPSIFKKLRKAG